MWKVLDISIIHFRVKRKIEERPVQCQDKQIHDHIDFHSMEKSCRLSTNLVLTHVSQKSVLLCTGSFYSWQPDVWEMAVDHFILLVSPFGWGSLAREFVNKEHLPHKLPVVIVDVLIVHNLCTSCHSCDLLKNTGPENVELSFADCMLTATWRSRECWTFLSTRK